MKHRRWKHAVLAVISAVGLFGGCDHKKEAAAPPAMPPPEVGVVTVGPEAVVLETELPGRTRPYRIAEIRPQVNGIVQKRLFTEGSQVQAGEVLYEIDPASFEAALVTAEANLNVARKTADRARTAVTASEASVARQKATLELARTNRQRLEELFAEKAVSASSRDQAVTDMEVAEAALQVAQAQIESDQQAVAVAEAAIEQAQAAIETVRINLGYTRITAPISGNIGRSSVTDGALVTAHQPAALATIQQLDPIYVDVPQSTAELLRLRRRLAEGNLDHQADGHEKVTLTLEDGTRYPLEGTLQFRDVTVEPTTGSVTLRAVFPNPDGLLLPGMFVRATVIEGVNRQAILVSQQAVSRDARGTPMAMIVDADGKVAVRVLTIDRAIGNRWLVSTGLSAGDRLIVDGLLKARPGTPVRAVPVSTERQATSDKRQE